MSIHKDKKIIITGASKGLGLVAARALAEKGANLVLMARSGEKLEGARKSCREPARHLCVPVDLIELKQIAAAVERAIEFFGGEVDAVLHVAGGGLGLKSPLLNSDELYKMYALNLAAAAEINRLIVPGMTKRQSGNLVHVGSIASYEGVGSVGYNTMKAGLSAYVRSLGRELAGSRVIVNGIMPGGFHAPENAMDRLVANNPEAYKKFVDERLPRKVMGDAEELIPMLLLLSSSEASMMSGCMVPIDAAEGRAYSQ